MSRPGVATRMSKAPLMFFFATSKVVPPRTLRTRRRVVWVKGLKMRATCSPSSRVGTMTMARGWREVVTG